MIVGGELLRRALEQARRNVEANAWLPPSDDPLRRYPFDLDDSPEPEGEEE